MHQGDGRATSDALFDYGKRKFQLAMHDLNIFLNSKIRSGILYGDMMCWKNTSENLH